MLRYPPERRVVGRDPIQPTKQSWDAHATRAAKEMSVLPADVHNALGQLLQALSSADNTTRSNAEESLNKDWVVARPDVLLMGLVEQMQATEDPTVKSALLSERVQSS